MLALGVVALWGLNFLAIRYGLDHFPPFFFAFLRFAVLAVPVVLFVRFPKVKIGWFLLYSFGFGFGQFALLFLAMTSGMPTGLASLVLQTSAPFTVVLGVLFLRERLSPAQWAGIGIAVAGIAVIGVSRVAGTSLGVAALLPIGLTVLAGLSWSLGNIGGRLARPDDALRMTLWLSVLPALPMFALSAVTEGPTAGWEALKTATSGDGLLALGGLIYIAILGTVVGAGIWAILLNRYPASRVSPMSLLVPVVGMTASWLAFGEVPSTGELTGAALIIVGCAAGVAATGGRRPAEPEPVSVPECEDAEPTPVAVSSAR